MPVSSIKLPDGPKISFNYNDPDLLVRTGPLIKATWGVPSAHAEALRAAGKPVPAPVAGLMLIDTGASRTAIAQAVVQELSLKQVGMGYTLGAGGKHTNPIVAALLTVTIEVRPGVTGSIQSDQPVMAIPELDKAISPGELVLENYPTRVIGLLGRDFLRHVTFVYDGQLARFEIAVHHKSMPDRTDEITADIT